MKQFSAHYVWCFTIILYIISSGCGTNSDSILPYSETNVDSVWTPITGLSYEPDIFWLKAEACSSMRLGGFYGSGMLLRFPNQVIWESAQWKESDSDVAWLEGVFADGGYLFGQFLDHRDLVLSRYDSNGQGIILWSKYQTVWDAGLFGIREVYQFEALSDGSIIIIIRNNSFLDNEYSSVTKYSQDGVIQWESMIGPRYATEYWGQIPPLEFEEGIIAFTTRAGLELLDAQGVGLGIIDSIIPYGGGNTANLLADGGYIVLEIVHGLHNEDEPDHLSVTRLSRDAQLNWEIELTTPMAWRSGRSAYVTPARVMEVSSDLYAVLITNPLVPGASPGGNTTFGIDNPQSPGVGVALIDSTGQLLWERTAFGERYSSVGISISDGLYLYGLNSTGSCLWTQPVSMDGVLGTSRMCIHSNGARMQICADIANGDVIGCGTAPIIGSASEKGVYVCKVNRDAEVVWERVFDLGDSETVVDIVELDSGVIAVTGLVCQGYSSSRDVYVLFLNEDGNLQSN